MKYVAYHHFLNLDSVLIRVACPDNCSIETAFKNKTISVEEFTNSRWIPYDGKVTRNYLTRCKYLRTIMEKIND